MPPPQIALGEIQFEPATGKPPTPAQAATSVVVPTPTLSPLTYPQDWDTCTVQGVRSPGIIPKKGISGLDRVNKWDVKEGKGTKGATTTYVGRPPIPFSVKFWLWLDRHFAEWDKFSSVLKYDPTKKAPAEAVSFYHPMAADEAIGVSQVVVTKVGGLIEEDDNGLYSRSVDFLEYAPSPPTNATATPKSTSYAAGKSDPNASPGTQPDPAITKLQQQAKQLAQQAQQTA